MSVPTCTGGRLRVIGASVPDVSDWRERQPAGKWSQLFGALAERVELVDTVRPTVSRRDEWVNLARSFHPSRARWKAQSGFNIAVTDRRSASIHRQLASRAGTFDLVLQLQTLFSSDGAWPYTIYTDNTFALTERIYPQWAPLSSEMSRRWQAFETRTCRDAVTVFTFSEFARSSVIEDYGCPPDRVVAIGAGANHLVSSVVDKDYEGARALFVGHPFELKGGPTLLKAWPAVRARVPDAELIIAGPKSRPPEPLTPGVRWLGRVTRPQLDELYRAATVFVLPSMFDAWGHVFVEAMGHGLPCIGTDCCAMPEIIQDRMTGRLVPRGEREPLADALVGLLGDPAAARTMGRRAHARVLDQLTWSKVADRLLERLPAAFV